MPASDSSSGGSLGALKGWFDRNFGELCREFRWAYLPPLMVYLAAGVQGLTAIVGMFFIKGYLGLSAEFLAGLGFWLMLPWALKMPAGHLVDLLWRYKAGVVYLGASLIACSLLIMVALLTDAQSMRAHMSAEAWFVLSAMLAPIGFMLQDVVADAMTVEAVARVDEHGRELSEVERKSANVTVQTLGRVAIVTGLLLVSIVNYVIFEDVQAMDEAQKLAIYALIYKMALIIPIVSVTGVVLAKWLRSKERERLLTLGLSPARVEELMQVQSERPHPNWWILGGSAVFVAFSLYMGLSEFKYGQEVIFLGSMGIVSFLLSRLLRELDANARATLLGTAFLIFVFRALPGPGPGVAWWQIDLLKFDERFMSLLAIISGALTLLGLFLFRRFMAEKSIAFVIGFLTLVAAVLTLPTLGMAYGLHEWTAKMTGGVVDARFIAVINEMIESPFGQIAMVPMLAWIAHSAPQNLKATYFAVMASFTNLALSLSQLGTKYLNQIYTISREVKDSATGSIKVPADYSDLGPLLITVILTTLILPFAAIALTRMLRLRSA